jgi:hypothetical protein
MEAPRREFKPVDELVEIIFEEEQLSRQTAKKDVEKIISEKMFGPGLVDKRLGVKWGGMFSRNQCPVCQGTMEKKDDAYVCSSCSFSIPADVFEKAKAQHNKEFELREREEKVRSRMGKMKLTDDEIGEVYRTAMDRVERVKTGSEKKDET